MKISAILIAFASVAVAAPLPTSNDEHALSARGFRSTVSGMNPFGKKQSAKVHNVDNEPLDTAIATLNHWKFTNNVKDLQKQGVVNEKQATRLQAASSTKHRSIINAGEAAQTAQQKSQAALNAQAAARKARQDVFRPTGVRDFFGKIGNAGKTTKDTFKANAEAKAARHAALAQQEKVNAAQSSFVTTGLQTVQEVKTKSQ